MKQSVTVKLAGQTLNLRTEDEPSYVQSLARYFAERIEAIKVASGSASGHQAALLAGMQVVDELFQARHAMQAYEKKVQGKVERTLKLLEQPEPA